MASADGYVSGHLFVGLQNLLSSRAFSCWRPLVSEVLDCPLAFCRRGTIDSGDFVPYDRVDGTGDGEGMFLKQGSSQAWYWLSRQTCDEVSFFESWDSMSQGCDGEFRRLSTELLEMDNL